MKRVYRAIRKVVIAIIGSVVVALGIILIPLPGPGILVTVAGLAILSLEFEWAEKHLLYFKKKLRLVIEKSRKKI
ncbi:MAG TPA: PGPGW domain-containing protein [Candidatus Saccharimonadales bacterium]